MDRHLAAHLRGVRGQLALEVALALAATGAVVVQMLLLGRIVAGVLLHGAGLPALSGAFALLLVAGAARAALAGGRETVAQRAAIDVKSALRAQLLAHLFALGPAYCEGERTGELVTTAVEGVERLDAYVARYLPQTVLSVVVPFGLAAVILRLDPVSAALLVLTAPIFPALMIVVGKQSEARVARQWTALGRLGGHFLDAVQGLPTLILFGRAEAESARIARVSERFRQRTLDALRFAFLSGMVLEFMTATAIGVVAVTLGVRLLDGGIDFERAFVVLLLTPEFYRPLRELGVQRHAGMEGQAALARIAQVLDTRGPQHSQSGHGGRSGRQSPEGVRDESRQNTPLWTSVSSVSSCESAAPGAGLVVALRDVAYTYPGADRPAVDGVGFELRPGTGTALVGRSGAGKTTLTRLLLRFVDPDRGAITASGVALGDLPADEWRRRVALVPQHPYLFVGTVRENLLLARPSATDAELERAAAAAGATAFIARLPLGYDTPLGERGARLSAGEVQRLAIARAFVRDAPLLILDEPTSSLDPESEALIRRALRAAMRERTVLVVAHRLNTVLAADQVVVLEDGRAVEVGSHAALARSGGAYARLLGAARAEGPDVADGAVGLVAREVGA